MTTRTGLTNTFNPNALRQRISRVPSQASAYRSHTTMDTMSTNTASVGSAGYYIVGNRTSVFIEIATVVASWIVVYVMLGCNEEKVYVTSAIVY